jgi:hypothetical protein
MLTNGASAGSGYGNRTIEPNFIGKVDGTGGNAFNLSTLPFLININGWVQMAGSGNLVFLWSQVNSSTDYVTIDSLSYLILNPM